jgi:hypothetical protein
MIDEPPSPGARQRAGRMSDCAWLGFRADPVSQIWLRRFVLVRHWWVAGAVALPLLAAAGLVCRAPSRTAKPPRARRYLHFTAPNDSVPGSAGIFASGHVMTRPVPGSTTAGWRGGQTFVGLCVAAAAVLGT